MAATKQLSDLNLALNQLLNAVIHKLAAAPGSPTAGQVYYDTTLNEFGYYNGSAWVYSQNGVLTVAAADGTITIAGTAANPTFKVTKTLDHTYVTDFDAQVRTSRLDQMAAPMADVSANSQKITSLADPVNPQDAANLRTVQNQIQGMSPKGAVQAATTAALAASTYANGSAGVGATLTANANGALAAIDGYTAIAGDRILVKNQATPAQNGIYSVTQVGTGSTPFILTRVTDNDDASEITGAFCYVLNGTTNLNQGFIVDSAGPYVIGTTAITWTQFSGAADLAVTAPIVKTGNTLSLAYTPTQKVTGTIGDGAATSIAVNHGLNSRAVVVALYDSASFAEVETDVVHTDANNVTFNFAVAPAAAAYTYVIVG